MGKVNWDDRALKKLVDDETAKLLNRIGIRGEALAKHGITGRFDPALKAIKTGDLRASISWRIFPEKLMVQVGVFKDSAIGRALKYAIYVFEGTAKMTARPVLRQMLMMIRAEMKGK